MKSLFPFSKKLPLLLLLLLSIISKQVNCTGPSLSVNHSRPSLSKGLKVPGVKSGDRT